MLCRSDSLLERPSLLLPPDVHIPCLLSSRCHVPQRTGGVLGRHAHSRATAHSRASCKGRTLYKLQRMLTLNIMQHHSASRCPRGRRGPWHTNRASRACATRATLVANAHKRSCPTRPYLSPTTSSCPCTHTTVALSSSRGDRDAHTPDGAFLRTLCSRLLPSPALTCVEGRASRELTRWADAQCPAKEGSRFSR